MSEPWLLGVEIGGTKLQFGVSDRGGRLIKPVGRIDAQPRRGAEGIREQIAAALPAWLKERGISLAAVAAAAIGFGGPVDAGEGVVTASFQVDGWENFRLAAWFRETFGIRNVSLQNDADTAALGEARFGAGVGLSPILYVNSGSGIGGGLVVDGRIYRGAGHGALEIGHLWVDHPSRTEGVENGVAELEDVASGWAIERRFRLRSREVDESRVVKVAEVVLQAQRGDSAAAEILGEAALAMGRGLAHAVTLLAPRRIILGGGVSLMPAELWLEPICRELDDRVFPPFRGTYDVVAAALGEEVVVQGALALAVDAMPRAVE